MGGLFADDRKLLTIKQHLQLSKGGERETASERARHPRAHAHTHTHRGSRAHTSREQEEEEERQGGKRGELMSKGVTRRRQSRQALNFSSLLISAKRDRWKPAGLLDHAGPLPWPGCGWGFDSAHSKPLDLPPPLLLAQRCIIPCSPPALACKDPGAVALAPPGGFESVSF